MIIIGTPYITDDGNDAVLQNEISIDNRKETIWFKVDSKYRQYLCKERDDAYLIACLHYAMVNGHDIVCEAPITEDLLYKVRSYLIPALVENNPTFHHVKITALPASDTLPCAEKVATGISCGVDSFHALAEHTASEYQRQNITHLTFNNVGSHGNGESARELFLQRRQNAAQFAKDFGFEFVWSDSNLMDVIEQSHFKTHTYSSMFPVLCLQKLYSIYYYASGGYTFKDIALADGPTLCCGTYDLLSLDCFSTRTLKIYSEGFGKSRKEKLMAVVNYAPSYGYLNVCLRENDNCNKCEKCVRTLLGLDMLGSLDRYKDVFDIDYYRSHRKWYLQQLLNMMEEDRHDYFEMYPYFRHELTAGMHLKAKIYKVKYLAKEFVLKRPTLHRRIKRIKAKLSK